VSTRRPPSLRVRHVVVIGGASGIGRGIAEAALAAGALVTVADGSEASRAKAQEEMGPGVQAVEADLASECSLE
jgi:NAD(P)-dependent dehydrogenase (short-subunit alcohol dehydrogenase family)